VLVGGRTWSLKLSSTPRFDSSVASDASALVGLTGLLLSALLAYLTDRKGFEPEEIEAAGLAIRRESGGYYDRFRGRLMFPIRDAKGQVIAFGGRALGDAQPKYMNSPQTLLFDKSRVLYGLDLARDTIRASDSTVIVEGYVDVIIAHQYGFHNVVAPLGTALTGEHVGVIKKLAAKRGKKKL
jgi:DNA primase